MEELLAASDLLVSALRRYNDACFAATKEHSMSNDFGDSARSLVNLIAREMQAIPTYEADLQKTRIILAQCRNSGRTISPINALPVEILARIFEMAHNFTSCSISGPDIFTNKGQLQNPSAMFPDALSHVCTRWRQVALRTPELWAHIDLTTFTEPLFKNLLARGQIVSERASLRRLNLHFAAASDASVGVASLIHRMQLFNRVVMGRIRRLELETWAGLSGFERLLEQTMTHTEPDVLEELIIRNNDTRDNTYTRPASSTTRIIHTNSLIDPRLYALTRLTLEGAYFPWSSAIYTGLIDLRIFAGRDSLCRDQFPIGYLQLARILSACPALRVLHFNLPIEDFAGWTSVDPVPLRDLEELNIRRMSAGTDRDQHEMFLPLLAPGSKPLNLSLSIAISGDYACRSQDMFSTSVHSFFRRSNTTALYVTITQHPAENFKPLSFSRMLAELSANFVQLSILGLEDFDDSSSDGELLNTAEPGSAQIDTLILHRPSSGSMKLLPKFVGLCSVRKLVVRSYWSGFKKDSEIIYKDLAKLVPTVRYSEIGPQQAHCPIDEWASLGHLDW